MSRKRVRLDRARGCAAQFAAQSAAEGRDDADLYTMDEALMAMEREILATDIGQTATVSFTMQS